MNKFETVENERCEILAEKPAGWKADYRKGSRLPLLNLLLLGNFGGRLLRRSLYGHDLGNLLYWCLLGRCGFRSFWGFGHRCLSCGLTNRRLIGWGGFLFSRSRNGRRGNERFLGSDRIGEGSEALVLLAVLLDHVARNKMLQLLVSSEAEHLLTTAGGIPLLKSVVDDVEELLELERSPLFHQYGNKFLGDQIGESAGEGAFTLHGNSVVLCSNWLNFCHIKNITPLIMSHLWNDS